MPAKLQHVKVSDLNVGDMVMWLDGATMSEPGFTLPDIINSAERQASGPFKVVLALHSCDLFYSDSNLLPADVSSIEQALTAVLNSLDDLSHFKTYNVSVITNFTEADHLGLRTFHTIDVPCGWPSIHRGRWFADDNSFQNASKLDLVILFTVTFE